jgi:histidine kinase
MLDALPHELYVLDEHLEVRWVNERALDRCSTKNAFKRRKAFCYKEIFDRPERCDNCPAVKTFESGEIETAEIRTQAGDEHRHFLATSVPLGRHLTDDAHLVVEMVQEITASKRVEEQLRRISELNSAIIENAPVAIFTIDKNGMFLSVNPALGELSGLGAHASEKLLGFNWLRNRYTINCGLADYIRKGLQGEAFELWDFPFANYLGESQYMHFRGVPLRTKDGTVEGLLCIIEETSERVRISAQLMQEGKMSAIGRLTTAIAHELNNPLATLVAHAELACDLIPPSGQGVTAAEFEELRGYLEVVQKQAFQCKEIIKHLFDLLWSEGIEEGSIDVNYLLNDIVEAKDFSERGIKVTRAFRTDLPLIKGDSRALRQVFMNITQNALDAMEARTGAEIRIKTEIDEECIRVEFEDNGPGIPDTIADHIFEPFFTTKKSSKGMGLGLTICHDLMEKMRGGIEMRQRQGGGSVFRISLPVVTRGGEDHGQDTGIDSR